MKMRIVGAVTVGWLVVATVWASQTVLQGNLLGNPTTMSAELQSALIQTVPWIPVTLAVIALAVRFPMDRRSWRRHLPVHVAAFALLVWVENMLVVLGFWLSQPAFQGIGELAVQGARWAVLRAHVAAIVYIAIAGSTWMIAYYRAARVRELRVARLEGQLTRARLDALNAQIRPHFLFNTLHTIGQLWRAGHADEADEMLDHLGSLFQRVRQSTQRPLVSLRDEFDMVHAYLAIEKARFRDRMVVSVDADDAALECGVPPLLLQPIVENAVRHGIATTSDSGRIDVRARVENGSLVIFVEDDGCGLRPDAPTADHVHSNTAGTLAHEKADPGAETGCAAGSGLTGDSRSGGRAGTGIANTRERLEQLFGKRHRFEIGGREPRGTRVRIVVPALAADREGDNAAEASLRDG